MKKVILMSAVILSLASCKKGETVENVQSTNSEKIIKDSVQNENMANYDNASITKTDSATEKISVLENEKKERLEALKKSATITDSLKISKTEKTPEVIKTDTARKNNNQTVQVKIQPEKIIKEQKIIYKNRPVTHVQRESAKKYTATAYLEMNSEYLDKSIFEVKNLASQYDAKINSETVYMGSDHKTSNFEIEVPQEDFTSLVYNLQDISAGELVQRNIENKGTGKTASIELVLNGPFTKSVGEGFGSKTLAAISSGTNALGSIFLFLLPFWPLLLIALLGYLVFLLKKNGKQKI